MSNPHARAETAPPVAASAGKPWAALTASGVVVATLCAAIAGLVGHSDTNSATPAQHRTGSFGQQPGGQGTPNAQAGSTTTRQAPDGSTVVVALHKHPDGSVSRVTTRTAPDGTMTTVTETNTPGGHGHPGTTTRTTTPGGPPHVPSQPPGGSPTHSSPTHSQTSSPTWTASPIPTDSEPPTTSSSTSEPPTTSEQPPSSSSGGHSGGASTLPNN